MLGSIKDDILRNFRHGNMVTRLILINVAVFVLFALGRLVFQGFNDGQLPESYHTFVHFFSLSSDWSHLLWHPWVFFTATFLHIGLIHLLFNMLYLYVFGRIVGDLIGDRHILPIYIMGGIVAGVIFFLSALVMPYGQNGEVFALGASGGIMAIVVAAGLIAPDYELNLLLLGRIRLKYIVAALILLDILALGGNINTGGHFAHLGGVLFGFVYIHQIRNGQDIGQPFNRVVNNIRSFFQPTKREKPGFSGFKTEQKDPKPKPNPKLTIVKTAYKKQSKKRPKVEELDKITFQEQLDHILEKIKQVGYENLTKEEKEFLFKASKRK